MKYELATEVVPGAGIPRHAPRAVAAAGERGRSAGVVDVGEQATGTRTSLIFTVFRKNVFSAYRSREVFPLDARGLLRNIALCSSGFSSSFPSAEAPRNACTFLSEKSPLGFRGTFFIAFRAKSFRPHGPS
jgi:hypothetical protein